MNFFQKLHTGDKDKRETGRSFPAQNFASSKKDAMALNLFSDVEEPQKNEPPAKPPTPRPLENLPRRHRVQVKPSPYTPSGNGPPPARRSIYSFEDLIFGKKEENRIKYTPYESKVLANMSNENTGLDVPAEQPEQLPRIETDLSEIALALISIDRKIGTQATIHVGNVGALTIESATLYSSGIWTGDFIDPYVENDGHGLLVHGVSAKIDGVPMLPVRIEKGNEVHTGAWIFSPQGWKYETTSVDLGHMAEQRGDVIYVREPLSDNVLINNRSYELKATPIVMPGEIALLDPLMSVSDGYILHAGYFEYKVKHLRTVDLQVSSTRVLTHEGQELFTAGLPDGIYEFCVNSQAPLRQRHDKQTPNSIRVYEKVLLSPSAASVRRRFSKVPAKPEKKEFWDMFASSSAGFKLLISRQLPSTIPRIWDVGRVLYDSCVTRIYSSMYRRAIKQTKIDGCF